MINSKYYLGTNLQMASSYREINILKSKKILNFFLLSTVLLVVCLCLV